jgi:hypothetical protein
LPNIRWITATLRTVELKSLQSISLEIPHYVVLGALGLEVDRRGWLDLDRLLVQFWTLTTLRLELLCEVRGGEGKPEDNFSRLLPESTESGIVNLIKRPARRSY